jgi:hypothetical protein
MRRKMAIRVISLFVSGRTTMEAMPPYIPVSIPTISGRAAMGGRFRRFMAGFIIKSI